MVAGRTFAISFFLSWILPVILSLLCPPAVYATGLQEPAPPPASAAASQDQRKDVTDIDLDDLLRVRVTSAEKKEQPLADVPAAIYVLRDDDIRRTGATSIAEALVGVPGLEVARNNSNTWAITARGLNDTLANKMLVLMDGRSVYSPLHSGVYWDVQDTFLEDIDRIEVIRGPGGALWGANAVNGVINILTKPAENTQGILATAGGGTEERDFFAVRYGFKAGDDLYVRAYVKYNDRSDEANGIDADKSAHDGWYVGRAGFRSDWKPTDQERLTVQGDFYTGQEQESPADPTFTPPSVGILNDRAVLRGGNLTSRWEDKVDATSSYSLQFYFDYTYRADELFTDSLYTADLDFQDRLSPLAGHDLIWGLGARIYRSETEGSLALEVDPRGHTENILSAFIQDEISLVPERLKVILGSKFERNTPTGFNWQPSGRVAWTPDDRETFWAAASHAVRTPSIIDRDGRLNPIIAPGPLEFSIFGDHRFRTEDLLAYEAGYRVRPVDPLSFDLALFYNSYRHLRSGEVEPAFIESAPPPAHLVIPIDLGNDLEGQTRGVELATKAQAAPWWLLQVNYTYLHMNLNEVAVDQQSPRQQAWLRSSMDLGDHFRLDVMPRYVGAVPNYGVKAYEEVDARIAWRDPAWNGEIELVGQNLAHESHPEFLAAGQRSEIKRGGYIQVTWRF